MRKKYLFFISLLILFVIGIVINHFKVDNVYEEENLNNSNNFNKGISMNLEQTAGAGDYKLVTQSEWPTEGYIFNSELSKCENGSTLSWDDTKKSVIMQGNVSDKCYVYFDKYMPPSNLADACDSGNNLATCVTSFANKAGPSISNIYYHDSYLENGAGDNSYRYAGANPNNYVCFGSDATTCSNDNLYRIIGVFDGKVKLIKYDYATSVLLGTDYYYGTDVSLSFLGGTDTYKGSQTNISVYFWNDKDTNTWSESSLNNVNLNTNFINNIGANWANKIATTIWKVGGSTIVDLIMSRPPVTYQYEVVNPAPGSTSTTGETEYSSKIGLMYLSDYGFAASPEAWTTTLKNYSENVNGSTIRSKNWMYMGLSEWTITRYAAYTDRVFYVQMEGFPDAFPVQPGVDWNSFGIRPVFFLNSSITYVSGDGTMDNPIRIS